MTHFLFKQIRLILVTYLIYTRSPRVCLDVDIRDVRIELDSIPICLVLEMSFDTNLSFGCIWNCNYIQYLVLALNCGRQF